MDEIKDIETTLIEPSPYQSRRMFDTKSISELAESIKTDGLINPITVRPKNGGYELLAGERRWIAVKELGWETIKATVRENIDDRGSGGTLSHVPKI
jgi:ParB family chromosome partitioning protein